ncbi:MAG TPA: FKBP-type peptidyl-prolyl cis-trans isomerase [Sphingomonadaceae bacterium]
MAEISHAPLQPIRKGSLPKLWAGVILLIALGVFLAWLTVPAAVKVITRTPGTGGSPTADDVVYINYTGKLPDGTVFDQQQGAPLPLGGGMIPGFTEGLTQMQKGGKYTLEIPASKAYGAHPPEGSPIPPNSKLTFDIDLLDFMSKADFQRRMQMMQQMQQMQRQQGASGAQAAGAPPPQ